MTWGECYRLTMILCHDPSSQVAVAVGGLTFPASRESLVLMDLFDLQHRSKAKKKPQPYPRPWGDEKKRLGRTALSPARARAALRLVGPSSHPDATDRLP